MFNFRAGDLVEVRSKDEILRTLDQDGKLDALPFMPEMQRYCGKRFRVFKSAHKTCDTITYRSMRRMKNAVHLEGVRCEGSSHGGCQARCLIFWKDTWLKPVDERNGATDTTVPPASGAAIDEATLIRKAQIAEDVFSCQATELNRATTELSRGDLGQYLEDLRSRNVRLRDLLRWIVFDIFTALSKIAGYRAFLWIFNRLARWLGGADYPVYQGTLTKTPDERLDLQPGELVRIKDREAIVRTLDTRNRNRGLSFDIELVNYCGGAFRVLQRVEKVIDEKTGKMIRFSNPSTILEGVTCQAYYKNRGCPRSSYHFLRDIWLTRFS